MAEDDNKPVPPPLIVDRPEQRSVRTRTAFIGSIIVGAICGGLIVLFASILTRASSLAPGTAMLISTPIVIVLI